MKTLDYISFYKGHLKRTSLKNTELTACCPFHKDNKPSFSVNVKTGQFYCHACKAKGNAFTFAKRLKIPFEKVPGYKRQNKTNKKLVATYDYVDENDQLLYQVCRYEPKAFHVRRPKQGGGWIYNLDKSRRVLYRFPEMMSAQTIIIVEGEKDVDALFKNGYTATTCTGGAGKWRDEYNDVLAGKNIILIPDNDLAGKDHMQDIQRSLTNAATVKLLQLPRALGPKADVSDFLNTFGPEQLTKLIYAPMPELENIMLDISEKEVNNFTLTDSGNAQLLCKCYGDKIRFLHDERRWLIWNGHIWQSDDLGRINLFPELVNAIRLESSVHMDNKSKQKEIARWVRTSESKKSISASLSIARNHPMIATKSTAFDQNDYVLGCKNGVLNLKNGQLEKTRVAVSQMMATHFDSSAKCPRWIQFINEIFKNDKEIIDFIHKAVGYSLTGSVQEECLFILYGKGANGKSTFLNVLSKLLGDYADSTPFSTFIASKYDGTKIPNDIASLYKKRFVTASEVREKSRLNEERIKSLTGGDTIKARFLRKEFFSFEPTFKFWLAVNHKPNITDTSEGFWRRIRLVPFEQSFNGAQRDDTLESKLLQELPGILNWAIDGCLAWQDQGLHIPKKIAKLTQDYQQESNVLQQFLDENTEPDPTAMVNSSQLFSVWKTWAENQNERPMTQTMFSRRMVDMGFTKVVKTKSRRMHFSGLRLQEEIENLSVIPRSETTKESLEK